MPGEKVIRFRPGRIEVTLGGMLLLKLPLPSLIDVTEGGMLLFTGGALLTKNRCALAPAGASTAAKAAAPAMDTFRRIPE